MAIERVPLYTDPVTGIADVVNTGNSAFYTIIFLDNKRRLIDLSLPGNTLEVRAKNDKTPTPDSYNYTLTADPDQVNNKGRALLQMPASEHVAGREGEIRIDVIHNDAVRGWYKITQEVSEAA